MSFARQSLGSLLALVFGVAVSVMLPRVLGPEARGEYQLAVKLAGLEGARAAGDAPVPTQETVLPELPCRPNACP